MKMIVLSSVLIAMFVMTGCTTQEPVVEEKIEESTPVAVAEPVTEVAVVEEAPEIINVPTLAELEEKMRTVNFDFNKYNIDFEMEPRIITNIDLVKGDAANYAIKLEGHCDDRGSDEYNFALGLRRANAVKSAMIQDGVAAERISMVSLGESVPVCTHQTEACWYQNRRVEFKLLP